MPSPNPTTASPLMPMYPNGATMAVQMYIWDINTLAPTLWDGSLRIGSVVIGTVKIQDSSGNTLSSTGTSLNVQVTGGIVVTPGTATTGQLGPLMMAGAVSAPTSYTNNTSNPITILQTGELRVETSPLASIADSLTNSTSTVYEASRIIKASAGRLYGMSGFNSKTTGQFYQLHNTTTLPADTAVPVLIWFVNGSSPWALDFGTYGRYFSTGITVCNSSTGPTKTIGAADSWFDSQYL